MSYNKDLERAETIPDIFELVKKIVWKTMRKSRAGLELGLTELGNSENGLLGAYYPMGSNMIVMNKTPLKRIQETKPSLLKPYIFSILLHEYLHTLGYFNEKEVRALTHDICKNCFEEDSMVTHIAGDLRKFLPFITYPSGKPKIESGVRKVKNFDKSSISYIG